MNTQTETKALMTVKDWQDVAKDAAKQEEVILQTLQQARARRIGAEAALASLQGSNSPSVVAAPVATEAPAPAKRGRKPGTKIVKAAAKTAAKTAKQAKAQPAKAQPAKQTKAQPAKQAKAKPAKEASTPRKRADGQETLKMRISRVMGNDECRAADVVERLKAKGWEPKSDNLAAYISMNMSTSDLLDKSGWGLYRNKESTLDLLKGGAPAKTPVPATKTNGKSNGKKKRNEAQAETKAASEEASSVPDEVDLGGMHPDPFAL